MACSRGWRWGAGALALLTTLTAGNAVASEGRERSTQLDGRAVAWRESGPPTGTALILVHGWASDGRVWRQLAERLEGWRTIAVDLPGHGNSAQPPGPYDMDLFARAVAAVMDDADVDQAILVGHSNGTPVIRQVYRRWPERVTGLVILDGPLRSFVTPEMASSVRESLSGEGWQEVVRGFVEGMPAPDLTPELRGEIATMAAEQSQAAVLGGFEATLESGIWREDPIGVPVLMVLAQQPSWSEAYLGWLEELVADLELHVWSGAGHFLMIERPDDVAELVEAFSERVGGVGGPEPR